MLIETRWRLLSAMGIVTTCAVATGACSRKEEASKDPYRIHSRDGEDARSPDKPTKKGAWVPTEYKGFEGYGCPTSAFCTDVPDVTEKSEGEGPFIACGAGAKVPDEVVVKGYEGATATFAQEGTKKVRVDHPNACCYTYRTGSCKVKGRPLPAKDEEFLAAETIARSDWCEAGPMLDDENRVSLSRAWSEDAAMEHASIASFARTSLQLLALGAPSDLIAATHEAALDEVRHARQSYAIASRYAGRPLGPGPLDMSTMEPLDSTPAVVLKETFLHGCVEETIASLEARMAEGRTIDPEIRVVRKAIADDEARHAELAFRTLAWLVRRFGGEVVPTLRTLLESLAAEGATHTLRERAIDDVIVPCVTELLRNRAGTTSLPS